MSNAERSFIHDLASPLSVADARVRSLLRKANEGVFEKDRQLLLEGLQKLVSDIERIVAKLRERREVLIAQENAGSGKGDGSS